MSHQVNILAMWFYSSKCSPRRALPPSTLNFSFSQSITKVVSVQLNFGVLDNRGLLFPIFPIAGSPLYKVAASTQKLLFALKGQ